MIDNNDSDQGVEQGQQGSRGRLIPRAAQIVFAAVIIVPLAWSIYRFMEYAWAHPAATPTELRLPETILLLIVALALVWIPWHRLGVSVKKIGWLEFEQVVTVQKKESVDAVVALENRVVELERLLAQLTPSTGAPPTQAFIQSGKANASLRDLILTFLRQYQRWYFNAARIRLWGSKQAGFEKLSEYPAVLISQELARLLVAGLVSHRISESGSTLYKAI